ncbi:2-hydroxyacid dehydrogenase [Pseudoalteromonas tunicata]|uniref:2-hydroxyacid dehydrogenase n=1 Tax=Pseudoalteromonas tunicata TaxID=314281 RepID=UPI00273DB194|nr:2-hydroxyacid dehydrogenase [Pseudoalteromonas tunicata]MDP4982615.1 2-hydroxyacid dehydrogenase [Pseudoalteromonas tunicata]MDP5215468.1 2-hydroxyacid dehydrogenase [Pseudoalteromonas tunicata]
MKIAFFSAQKYEQSFFIAHNSAEHQLLFFSERLTELSAKLAQGCDAVCAFVNDDLSESVLQSLLKLNIKLVTLRCAGFNNVDLIAAKNLGINITRVPAYSPEAVAEHCIALMLTLSRKTHKAYNRVKEGNFDLNGLLGFNLHKKTVGVIGTGKIGLALCNILTGFGCRILAHDPKPSSDQLNYVSLEALLAESDIISLHCPLLPATHHMINDDAYQQMKPGVMLINTSRGALVDTKATIKALKNKTLGYLGLDVYEQESELFFKDMSNEIIQDDEFQRLLSFSNVLITGHQGFFTQEALDEIATVTFFNIKQFAEQRVLTNTVV